jgi:prepilin-type N-terminal cleavage/methylation domain-containing protein
MRVHSQETADASYFHAPRKNDGGFTLVELLVVMVVMPMIVGAIAFGLITMFNLQGSVGARLAGSGDAQVVSSLYVRDVQSASKITTAPTSSPMCGSGSQLLGLSWSSAQTVVSYVTVTTSTGPATYLERLECTLGNLTTPVTTTILSYDVQSAQAPPTVACITGVSSCDTTGGWSDASKIATVTFTIYEPTSKYTYTLIAAPRAWVAGPGVSTGGVPYAPFTLAETGACPSTVLSIGNNASLTINVGTGTGNGVLSVYSPCTNSVVVGTNGSITAGAVVTNNTSLASVTSGTSASEVYGTTGDPFSALTPPTAPSVSGSCTTSGTTTTCQPGVYSSALSFPNGQVINFAPGNYLFNAPVAFPNNATVTFATGTYSFGSGAAITTGNNVVITGNNVLIYALPSSTTRINFGNNTAVSLTGLPAYDGVVVWNAGTGAINLSNNTSTVSTYGGIYAPLGAVNVTNNGTFSTQFIYTYSASFSNNVVVQVSSP